MERIILSNLNDEGVKIEIVNGRKKAVEIFGFSDSSSRKVKLTVMDGDETIEEVEAADNVKNWIEKGNKDNRFSIVLSKEEKVPVMEYSDITEEVMLNGISINQVVLQGSGIWANSGIRLWKVYFDGDFFNKQFSKYQAELHFELVQGEKYSPRDFRFVGEIINKQAVFKVDTDLLGKVFEDEKYKDKQHVNIKGDVKITRSIGGGCISFFYPCSFLLINTSPDNPAILQANAASIDFGTSSTCVAIDGPDGDPELLSLSGDNDSAVNIYENPTNLMIFDWNALCGQWVEDKTGSPVLYKGSRYDYNIYQNDNNSRVQVDFDFGYNVKDILDMETSGRRDLNSILSLIKMTPYKMLVQEEQLEIIPFNDDNKFINIVTDHKAQDDKNFDPVAFYGYLIGRSINDVSKRQKVFTNFNVTRPVMFNDEVKEALRGSLEYGLKMSVPKLLRDKVRVNMDYTEPVAYIGAVCGKYLKVSDGECKPFAVYDFGGGTLDFSYGAVSSEDGYTSVNILLVSGEENVGGESIIERISFMLYCQNINSMKENDIPIAKPFAEKLPGNVPAHLITNNDYGRINMNLINAAISRKIFENREDVSDLVEIALYDQNGKQIDIKFIVPLDDIRDVFLAPIIEETVQQFKREMNSAFEDIEGYDERLVEIFLAGNSSRNDIVRETMNTVFMKNNVYFVDNDGDNPRYSINPKTAVAIGQLRLSIIEVNNDNASFRYYVGYVNPANNEFVVKIKRGLHETAWIKYRKIINKNTAIYYTPLLPAEGRAGSLPNKAVETPEKGYIFIRIKDEVSVEYCISSSDTEPSEEEAKNAKVLKLI